jgi:hypothetical protein
MEDSVMKNQAIIFTTHTPAAIRDLTAKGNAEPATKGNYLGFSPSEAAQHVFIPQTRRNAYGLKETEEAIPGSLNEILSQVDMGDN